MPDLGLIFKENPVNPGYCLVLRPIGGEYDRVWAEISRAFAETFAWADVGTLRGAGTIMEEVVREIARTDAVIADVSEARPNVFYELGIAHAMKGDKKVVIVKQSSTHVPFDLQAYRHLDYEPTPDGLASLLPELERRVRQALEPTSWFRVAEGGTYHSDPLSADKGFFTFDLEARALQDEPCTGTRPSALSWPSIATLTARRQLTRSRRRWRAAGRAKSPDCLAREVRVVRRE